MTGDMMIVVTVAMIAVTIVGMTDVMIAMIVAMTIVDLIVIGVGTPHVGAIANNYAGLANLNVVWATAVVIITNAAADNSFYA